MNGFHLLETSQWMALGNQFGNGTLMQCAGDQQNDVVDHVAVGDEVQKGGQWFDGMVAHMLEFDYQLFAKLIIDDGYRQWRRLVGKELAIVCALQMQFQICNVEVSRLLFEGRWLFVKENITSSK